MGALDSSRTDTQAPLDALLTRKVVDRLQDVAVERQFVVSTGYFDPTSDWFDPDGSMDHDVRLFGENYQYGYRVQVTPDRETHDVEVAAILEVLYQGVAVRFFGIGIDGRYHRLGIQGATSGTHNLSTLPPATRAMYTWKLDLGPLRDLGNRTFNLMMAVDSERDPTPRYYRIWGYGNNNTIWGPDRARDNTKSRLLLVEDTSYPVASSAAAIPHFKAFSTDWGDQPVKLQVESRIPGAAGDVWSAAHRDYLDYDLEPTYVAGLSGGVADAAVTIDDWCPDAIWMEPFINIDYIQQVAWTSSRMVTGTPHRYYDNHRVRADGLGEIRLYSFAVAGVSGTYTDGTEEFMEQGYDNSTMPTTNLTAWRAAVTTGTIPRAQTINRTMYAPALDLWAQRTPFHVWDSQALGTNIWRVDAVGDYEVFQEPLRLEVFEGGYRSQGDATDKRRRWATVKMVWNAWETTGDIPDHLYDVTVEFLDDVGTSLGTEVFEGAMTVEGGMNRAVDNDLDNLASAGRGFYGRRLNPDVGRYGTDYPHGGRGGRLDIFTSPKNWPSSDKPNRFARMEPLRDWRWVQPETFQADVEVPSGTSQVKVFLTPRVSASFFTAGNTDVYWVFHHYEVRETTGAGWDVIGV